MSRAQAGGPRRSTSAAFFTGAALFVLCAAAVISQGALARGPGAMWLGMVGSNFQADVEPRFIELPLGPSIPRHVSHKHHANATVARVLTVATSAPASFAQSQAVCVRLCDGYFFPASTAASSGDEASCSSLCPDAPTASYSIPAGSDRIEDAVSALGERYSALPVALRYRTTRDNTCTCHRGIASNFSPLRDPTLRRGDAVMTERGFAVFRGAEQPTHAAKDFAALSAVALPGDQRVALRDLERANAAAPRGVTRSWTLARGPSWNTRAPHSLIAAATASPQAASGSSQLNEIRFVGPPVASTN
jgi:hypothetical protein